MGSLRTGLLLVLMALPALSQGPRVLTHAHALVVANWEYPAGRSLSGPPRSLEAVDVRLRELGFSVHKHYNTSAGEFQEIVRDFLAAVGRGDLVVFYFSGRVARAGLRDLLLPVDTPDPARAPDVRRMMRQLEASGAALRLFLFDPVPDPVAPRAADGWLNPPPPSAPGTLVLWPATPQYGVFTSQVLRVIQNPNISVLNLMAQLQRLARSAGRLDLDARLAPLDPLPSPDYEAALQANQAQPAASPAMSPMPEPTRLERFPAIQAPAKVPVRAALSVLVSLAIRNRTPGVAVDQTGTGVELTPNGAIELSQVLPCTPRCRIDVVLNAPSFDLVGGVNQATVEMTPTTESTPARFSLVASDIPGPAEIEATFFYGATFLARAVTSIQVEAPGRAISSNIVAPAPAPSPVIAPSPAASAAAAPVEVPAPSLVAAPDLTLTWKETIRAGRHYCSVIVSSPKLHLLDSTSCTPGDDLARFLSAKYSRILGLAGRGVQLPGKASAPSALVGDELRGLGRELFDHFATGLFQKAFWDLVDSERTDPNFHFRTIQIYTNNPVLPWEILVPSRPGEQGRNFLGVDFQIARWHLGDRTRSRPRLSIEMDSVTALAPHYQGAAALRYQREELNSMHSLPGYREVAGTSQEILKLLDHPPQGIVHFAGHGFARPGKNGEFEYGLQLEDSVLSPEVWRGHQRDLKDNHPLFILNACDTGKEASVAGFIDGWPGALLGSGAAGFIGGLWPLGDQAAAEFSRQFYNAIAQELSAIGRVSVAELLRRTRARFAATNDPTFLAYVLYGDTQLQIVK